MFNFQFFTKTSVTKIQFENDKNAVREASNECNNIKTKADP